MTGWRDKNGPSRRFVARNPDIPPATWPIKRVERVPDPLSMPLGPYDDEEQRRG